MSEAALRIFFSILKGLVIGELVATALILAGVIP